MIDTIYLDLDDTINHMTMHFLKLQGCVDQIDEFLYPTKYGYNLVGAANSLHPTKTWTLQEWWDSFSRKEWATTPVDTSIFPWVLERCAQLVGRENVCIATSPTKDPDCLAGKLEWIQRHFPEWMHRQYAITPRKWLFARPGALLIDDCDENVDRFRARGGWAILVPRPWNSLGGGTRGWVEERMDSLKEIQKKTENF